MLEELNKKIKKNLDENKLKKLEMYIFMGNLANKYSKYDYWKKELTKDDVLNNLEEYTKFNNYFHRNKYKRECIITGIYARSFGDICADIILKYDKISLAKVSVSLGKVAEKDDVEEFIKKNYSLISGTFETMALEQFDDLIRLPKLSQCSKLLNYIYEEISNSDSDMCFITDEDYKEISNICGDNAIEILKAEVKKYHLDNYISFDYDDCKIIAYGDLKLKVNNDIDLTETKNYFEDIKYMKDCKLNYSNDIESKSTYLFTDVNGTEFYENKIDECIILKGSKKYNEFTYEEFLEELEYMLDGNLLDNISMKGHAVIRDFLVRHKDNTIAMTNYKKSCIKDNILLQDIQYVAKEKSYVMFDEDTKYSSTNKLNRLSDILYGVNTPLDGPYSYIASLDNGKDFYFDSLKKEYLIVDREDNIMKKSDDIFFLLKNINKDETFVNIDMDELKKLFKDFEMLNSKSYPENYAIKKLLDYNNKKEKNMFKKDLKLQERIMKKIEIDELEIHDEKKLKNQKSKEYF